MVERDRLTSDELGRRYGNWYQMLGILDSLKELARGLPDNPVVVNIGTGVGTSSLAFLESRPDLQLFSVDINGEDGSGSLEMEAKSLNEARVDMNRVTQVRGDSKKIGKEWVRGLVDMVFVDGDHSYEGCKRDALVWLPHVKDGGVMAFHDYANVHKDVIPAVDEVMEGYERIMLVSCLIAFRVKT